METEYNVVVLHNDTLYFCGFELLLHQCAVLRDCGDNTISLRACPENETNLGDFIRLDGLTSRSPSLIEYFKNHSALCTHFTLRDNVYYQTQYSVQWGINEIREAGFEI